MENTELKSKRCELQFFRTMHAKDIVTHVYLSIKMLKNLQNLTHTCKE